MELKCLFLYTWLFFPTGPTYPFHEGLTITAIHNRHGKTDGAISAFLTCNQGVNKDYDKISNKRFLGPGFHPQQ
jgi:hypothetical protein